MRRGGVILHASAGRNIFAELEERIGANIEQAVGAGTFEVGVEIVSWRARAFASGAQVLDRIRSAPFENTSKGH